MRYPFDEYGTGAMVSHVSNLNAEGATVAILRSQHPGAALVKSMLGGIGWDAEIVERSMVEQDNAHNWDLIVICAAEINSDVLVNVTAAAHDPDRRVFVISEEKEPQQIRDVLRAGGDDHLQYPFSSEECLARMRALTSRARVIGDRRRQGQLTFDFADHVVSAGPTRVSFTTREWDVLIALLNADGQAVTAIELANHGTLRALSEPALAAIVGRIRRKMRAAEFLAVTIVTVRGRGYCARFRRETDSFVTATKIYG
jgi:DNA-binding response OmpR family regulator